MRQLKALKVSPYPVRSAGPHTKPAHPIEMAHGDENQLIV